MKAILGIVLVMSMALIAIGIMLEVMFFPIAVQQEHIGDTFKTLDGILLIVFGIFLLSDISLGTYKEYPHYSMTSKCQMSDNKGGLKKFFGYIWWSITAVGE